MTEVALVPELSSCMKPWPGCPVPAPPGRRLMPARTPAEVLREYRRRDSAAKRQRVRDTLAQILRRGDPVTFAAVARAAGVSTWLVYADGVREHIERVITRQGAQPAAAQRTGQAASEASLRTDLELARAQIRQLRAERDELRDQVRTDLGHQLEHLGRRRPGRTTMRPTGLDTADAVEFAELLDFLGDWLESDGGNRAASLARSRRRDARPLAGRLDGMADGPVHTKIGQGGVDP
jgi:Family of unknown function (DUF6262)